MYHFTTFHGWKWIHVHYLPSPILIVYLSRRPDTKVKSCHGPPQKNRLVWVFTYTIGFAPDTLQPKLRTTKIWIWLFCISLFTVLFISTLVFLRCVFNFLPSFFHLQNDGWLLVGNWTLCGWPMEWNPKGNLYGYGIGKWHDVHERSTRCAINHCFFFLPCLSLSLLGLLCFFLPTCLLYCSGSVSWYRIELLLVRGLHTYYVWWMDGWIGIWRADLSVV